MPSDVLEVAEPEVLLKVSLSTDQYYTEVLGYEPSYLFEPSYGLLLRDDLHHGFDRGHVALWPLVSSANSQPLVACGSADLCACLGTSF